MTRLDDFIVARHARRAVYDTTLADLPLQLPSQAPGKHSAPHLYPVLVTAAARLDRATLFAACCEAGIGVNMHYLPVYRQPYYVALGMPQDECPVADDYYARALSIPLYATLAEADQAYVIATLRRLLG